MQQYYQNNYGETITEIGAFRVDKCEVSATAITTIGGSGGSRNSLKDLDLDAAADDEMEEAATTTTTSGKHILSQAYKVMVDVPDPPAVEVEQDAKDRINDKGRFKNKHQLQSQKLHERF
jgi:hypothetical protein